MIAVLSALEPEIRGIIAGLDNPGSETWAGRVLYQGAIEGVDVLAGFSGVGKSLSALVAQRVIDVYRPEALIYVGIAGALDSKLEIGDVVIGKDIVQHDMDASQFGFARGEIPHERIVAVESSRALVECAAGWAPAHRTVHVGRILTGDRVILPKEKAGLRKDFGALAVEMEGASAALAAHLNGVPFLLARIISDTADGRTPTRFQSFLAESSSALLELVRFVIGSGAIP